MIMSFCGCNKSKYQVYFDGNGFETKKTTYGAGEAVHVVYGGVASDTDYRFFCDPDVELKQEFDGDHSYVFDFTMPSHDVTLHLKKSGGMQMDTGEGQRPVDLNAQIDPEKMIFSYTAATKAAPGSHDHVSYTLYERSEDGRLILTSETEGADGQEKTIACLVPAVTLDRCLGIVKRYGMTEWKDGHGLRGKSYTVRLLDANGELLLIKSDDMPDDGRTAFDEIENTLGSAFSQFVVTEKKPAPAADKTDVIRPWICPECGEENTGKYCAQCGLKMPE